MRPDTVARRYARALFAIADEKSELEAVGKALEAIARLVEVPELGRVLTSPLGREQKRSLLKGLAEQLKAPRVLRDFLLLLSEHDRLVSLAGIAAVYGALFDRRQGITRAIVRSAAPLSDEALEEVTAAFSKVTGRRVIPRVIVDQELIAGLVVEVEGRVYDGSVRTQLERLQRCMAEGT